MTKPWKLKTNSSNILLVLITLILVKAEWANGYKDDSWNNLDNTIDRYQTTEQQSDDHVQVYVGNDEIAQFLFESSTTNASVILNNVNRCLEIFQLLTCLKMFLLETVNNVTRALEKPEMTDTDFYFMNGLIAFKVKNDTRGFVHGDEGDGSSLDDEIAFKVLKMFRNRSLRVNLLPKIKIDVEPVFERNVTDFICFDYKVHRESNLEVGRVGNLEEGRGKKKKGGGSMFMIIPPLLMLGFMPFTLASLKAMVMNAVMINMMALNGAIFMTIRNLVFGPRPGANVQYVNYGYSKNRQTKKRKPTLIIHSPAAFVKQPPHRKKPSHHYPTKSHASHGPHTNYHSSGPGSSYSDFAHSGEGSYKNHIDYDYDYDGGDDYTPGSDIGMHGATYDHKRRKHTMQRRVDDANENVIQGTNGYKTINNVGHDSQSSNAKVNPYQRTSTYKPEVRNQSPKPNQKESSSYKYWFPQDYYHPDNFEQSTLKTSHNPKVYSSGFDNNYKSNSFAFSKKEFKPSPQWDPVIPDNYSFGVNPNPNSNQSETLNNHNYRNV